MGIRLACLHCSPGSRKTTLEWVPPCSPELIHDQGTSTFIGTYSIYVWPQARAPRYCTNYLAWDTPLRHDRLEETLASSGATRSPTRRSCRVCSSLAFWLETLVALSSRVSSSFPCVPSSFSCVSSSSFSFVARTWLPDAPSWPSTSFD